MTEAAFIVSSAAVLAAFLTGLVRARALAHGIMDVPNQRSSHKVATPRGGGLAIVIVVALGACLLFLRTGELGTLLLALAAGIPVAVIGFADDRRPVGALPRLLIHMGAAAWAMAVLEGFPPLQVGIHRIDMGAFGYLVGALVIVWSLNLFNFMDGIDGIAASEAAFIGVAGGVLVLVSGGSVALATLCLVLAAACSGFLWWNWAPAKIFMGDVGSGFLGFLIAVLALGLARDQPAGPFVWLILGGVFVVDATVTLMRRLWRRERLYEAHRSHAYQCLARRWQSHRRVTLTVTAVNVFWLLPWATLATLYPIHAGWAALGAIGPLLVAAVAVGAGRQEPRPAPEA